jgi:heat shock protein HtpX
MSVLIIATIIKVYLHLRVSLAVPNAPFHLFGLDTVYILIIALVAAIIHWYYSNRNAVPRILNLLRAQQPDPHDKYHDVYNNVIDEIAIAAGEKSIERYIMPTGSMNAFALADLQGRKVIGITEGLLSRVSREELQAVVAHEMAHITSNDCLETTITCSLFSMYSETLAQLTGIMGSRETTDSPFSQRDSHKDIMTVGLLSIPLFFMLFLIDLASQMLNMLISREKEYRADAAAVRLTRNPSSLAGALYRIGTHWRGAGAVGERIRPIFIMNPQYSTLDEKDDMLANLFSTHPPLIRRLQLILDQAHADLDIIAAQIDRRARTSTLTEPAKTGVRVMALYKNEWQGPFTLAQLQTREWIAPDTTVKILGHDAPIKANEIPDLSDFFQKREEPMWKIKHLCPDCREWLIPQDYEGLYLWRCAYCNGILTEEGKLPRVFVRQEKQFTSRVARIASLIRRDAQTLLPHFNIRLETLCARHCPKCGRTMMHKFYSYAYHVEIDECQQCKVIWFDADELEILQSLIEMSDH